MLCWPILASHRLEIRRMVQLLLGSMRIRTQHAVGTPLLVIQSSLFPFPIRTWAGTVANPRMPPRILVVVGVDARLPIMLHADRAPECLESVHKKRVCQSLRP